MDVKGIQHLIDVNGLPLADALVIAELFRREEIELELRERINSLEKKKEHDAHRAEAARITKELEKYRMSETVSGSGGTPESAGGHDQLVYERDQLKKEHDASQAEIARLTQELKKCRFAGWYHAISSSMNEVERTDRLQSDFDKTIARFESEVARLNTIIHELTAEKERDELARRVLCEKFDASQAEVARLKRGLVGYTSEGVLDPNIIAATKELIEYQGKVHAELDNATVEFEKQIAAKNVEIEQLHAALKDRQDRINALELSLAKAPHGKTTTPTKEELNAQVKLSDEIISELIEEERLEVELRDRNENIAVSKAFQKCMAEQKEKEDV